MSKNMILSESLEDYLEVILKLEQTHKVARAKDIADKMKVKQGSVTGVLKNLLEKKLINYEPYSFITLTPKGKKIAGEITHRHAVIKDFLLNVLQLDEDTAESNACRMEHAIDKKTMERLLDFFKYIYKCPRVGEDWIEAFRNYCSSGSINDEKCRICMDDCRSRYKNKA